MNKNSLDRSRAVEEIKKMGEDDLIFLDRVIADRLNLIAQAKSTVLMAEFHAGERVCFQEKAGVMKSGVMIRLNRKTASIRTDDGYLWNVFPGFLKRESER
jgi:hypothetical protein